MPGRGREVGIATESKQVVVGRLADYIKKKLEERIQNLGEEEGLVEHRALLLFVVLLFSYSEQLQVARSTASPFAGTLNPGINQHKVSMCENTRRLCPVRRRRRWTEHSNMAS